MQVTLTRTVTISSRLTSFLYGVLMSAVALAGVPDLGCQARDAQAAAPVAQSQPVPVPVPQPTPTPVARPAALDQGTLAAYLAREWNLGRAYAGQVAQAILSASARHHIDPYLLMAVAAAESSFQHSVGNPGGGRDPMKPFGIMQVAGQAHPDKFPHGTVKTTSVNENVEIGASVLEEYLVSEGGDERRAVLRYNGSLHVSDKYFRKVTRFKQRLLHELHALLASSNPQDEDDDS